MRLHLLCAAALFPAVGLFAQTAQPRILAAGQTVEDARLQPPKDLDGYFPFDPPATRESWEKRAAEVRLQVRIALGLLPEPTRTPLNAVIHGKVDRGDYTVAKVFFEAMPGFFVTGNLYRPAKATGRMPAVLCPHGHWPDGRFMERDDKAMKKEMESGAEKFESAARSPIQARCVQLARMGCVVFHYDMIGYADSTQLSFELAHKFAKQRPEMNSSENWGLYSPQAESHAQSIMGLQTWSSIRAIDFLESLPDVDPKRIAVTGASGGATQTMMVAALDPRVAAAFPAVMVSTAMQGGCTCENASLLRIGTGNVEIAALFAPKPMAMTSADDWTKEMETKGFPELKQLWTTLGAPDNVSLTVGTQYPHNFNAPSRAAMADWFNKHLGLNLSAEQLVERDFHRLSREEMGVWNSQYPEPKGGPDFERKLLRWWHDDTRAKVSALSPDDLREARGTVVGWKPLRRTAFRQMKELRFSGGLRGLAYLQAATGNARVSPQIAVEPPEPNGWEVLWLSHNGKAGLFKEGTDELLPEVAALAKQGTRIIGVDLFGQGEFLSGGGTLETTPRVKNPREAAAYTFGYNPSVAAYRVQDVLDALHRIQLTGKSKVGIVAFDPEISGIATMANALKPVDALLLEPGKFRFGAVNDIHATAFLPAAARYGDVPELLQTAGKTSLFLIGSPAQPATAPVKTGDRATGIAWLSEVVGQPLRKVPSSTGLGQ